jgi:hypothetical protein
MRYLLVVALLAVVVPIAIATRTVPPDTRNYIWDCQSYRWKWEDKEFGQRHGYKTLANACVRRGCDEYIRCDEGNWGPIPFELLWEQVVGQ